MFSLLHCHFESVLRAIALEKPDVLSHVYRTFNSLPFQVASPTQRLHLLEEQIRSLSTQHDIFHEHVFERVVQTFLCELEDSHIEHVDLRIGIRTHTWRWMNTVSDAIAVFQRELRYHPTLSVSFLAALNLAKPLTELDAIIELLLHDSFIQYTFTGIDINLIPADFDKLRYYAPSLQRMQQQGMKLNVHLGELFDNDFSRQVLSSLIPDRIGHGVKLLEEADLVDFLQHAHICLDMCPVSNTQLGVCDWAHPHNPARKAIQLGIACTINTDDPLLFQTTLAQEFALANLNDEEVEIIRETGRTFRYTHA